MSKAHYEPMRVTLSLEDNLVESMNQLARQGGRTFEDVTNEVIRRGLAAGEDQVEGIAPFRVDDCECGMRPGVDPFKLNQV